MLTVQRVEAVEKLDCFRLPWRSLWLQTRSANYFQTLDWLEVYWRHFGQSQRMQTLLIFDEHKLMGIVPLTIIREATAAGPVEVLTYPLHDWGISFGPIGSQPAATLLAAMKFLAGQRLPCDMIDLRWIVPHVDAGRTETAMKVAGLTGWTGPWKTTSVVDFSYDWEHYLAQRSSKFRNNLKRCSRRAAAAGEVVYERFRSDGVTQGNGDPRWDLFDACLRVDRHSWQATSSRGTTISKSEIGEFVRDAHAAAVEVGTADVNVLWLDREPIAYAYNYCSAGDLFGLRMGFDKKYATLSPGRILLAAMIQDSFHRRDRILDLGPGYADAKCAWRTRTIEVERCSHYSSSSPRAQLLRMKRRLWGPSPLTVPWRRPG